MSTIARKYAEYSLGLAWDKLPQEIKHRVKKVLLDTLGCAFGGYYSEASKILRALTAEMRGPAESTVIGDGTRTSCLYATLANGVMIRYLDFTDTYNSPGPVLAGAHPGEIIAPVLAVAERQHATGKELLTTIVAGYELLARFTDGLTVNKSLESRGWNMDLKGGFVVPPVVGRLMRLSAEQVENAIGIAGSHAILLGILDAPDEEYTMAKNLRFPWAAHDGILAALIAGKGFTGPKRVIEGQRGLVESVLNGEFDFRKATNFEGFKIMDVIFKPFPSDMSTHGHLTASLHLVNKHDIHPEDIERIIIRATTRCVEHTGSPAKRYPKNKETADHSSYYLTAIAILDRQLGPEQYAESKYESPAVHNLIDKITFQIDPTLDGFRAAGISEIVTLKGERYRHRVDYPVGYPENPVTDEQIEKKFSAMASKVVGAAGARRIIEAVDGLESMEDSGGLMELLVVR